MLDFLATLLYFYNISFDFDLCGACFHTDFGICWSFYSRVTNCPTNRRQNSSISWTFSEISSKVQLLPSYACNKKTMIVITIAFVSGIPAVHMPESLNAEMSHVHHAQGSLISVVCRSSDLSIHVQTILLHKRIASAFSRSHDSSSNDRFSPHAGCILHGKQYFRNTATLGNPLCFV